MMNGIEPQKTAPAKTTPASGASDPQSAIQNLEQQKKFLQDELKRVKDSKDIKPEELKKQVEALEKQIKSIDAQIQKLKNNSTKPEADKAESAKSERFDEYVKESASEAEAPDNVYRVETEDGKRLVKFKEEKYSEQSIVMND